jgi:hypothetical protein
VGKGLEAGRWLASARNSGFEGFFGGTAVRTQDLYLEPLHHPVFLVFL